MRRSRSILTAVLLVTAVLNSIVPARSSQDTPPPARAQNLTGLHDFDFFVGDWRAHHRRLKERLTGSNTWEEFDGWCSNRALLGGRVNADDNLFKTPIGDTRGVGLAAYDPQSGQWAAWWLDGSNPFGKLDPPAKGRFENGVGIFYSDDTLRGKPVRARVTWSRVTPTSVHWEQALSPDGGKTWETNWITDFERTTSAAAQLESAPAPANADLGGLHAFDARVGHWQAHHRRLKERLADNHEWIEFDGDQSLWRVLGGYGNVDENVFHMPGGDYPGVTLRAYEPKSGRWAIWWLDARNPHGSLEPPVIGRFENGVGTFYSDDTLRGKPVRVRFTWSGMTSTSGHWEQAFSPDGGKTWEVNWVTDFRR